MADIAIFRINYKSDFILTLNSDAGWMTPFCIKFWTGAPSQAYFVGFDGTTYTHCAPVDGEPTKLRVQFDDHHLPIGDLKFQIGYHFTVADFPTSVEDEVLNQASVIIEVDDKPAQVMLDFNGETAPEIEFSMPAYANEAQRIANEEQRIENEQARISAENERISNEDARIAEEQVRVSQEAARVSEFAQLKEESQQATADANAAAQLANQKAQLAADKAALADDAATLANDKAALAQQKADYAETQGNYAKAQGDIAQTDHERAESDHTTAAADHTTAGNDHTRAESDHTRAESDHAAVEPFVDSLGAFDISAYHATGGVLAKYADLTAALGTNGANIPDTIRKGGMSVKFVLSSDNKYVQFRYIGTATTGNPNPFLDTANWQGVDDEPTAGSKNLVDGNGINNSLVAIQQQIGEFYVPVITSGAFHVEEVGSTMVLTPTASSSYLCTKVECKKGDVFYLTGSSDNTTLTGETIAAITDVNGKVLKRIYGQSFTNQLMKVTHDDSKYFVFSSKKSVTHWVKMTKIDCVLSILDTKLNKEDVLNELGSETAKPISQKAASDAINSKFDNAIVGYTKLEFTTDDGRYPIGEIGTVVDISEPVSTSNYTCKFFDCIPGDVFLYSGTSKSETDCFAILDKDNKVLYRGNRAEYYTIVKTYTNYKILIPNGGVKLVCNFANGYDYSVGYAPNDSTLSRYCKMYEEYGHLNINYKSSVKSPLVYIQNIDDFTFIPLPNNKARYIFYGLDVPVVIRNIYLQGTTINKVNYMTIQPSATFPRIVNIKDNVNFGTLIGTCFYIDSSGASGTWNIDFDIIYNDSLDLLNKSDKPSTFTENDIVIFDENGNPKDSGYDVNNLPSGSELPSGGDNGDFLQTDGNDNYFWAQPPRTIELVTEENLGVIVDEYEELNVGGSWTNAIQAAVDAAGVSGSIVFTPNKTYNIDSAITMLKDQVIIGNGATLRRMNESKTTVATTASNTNTLSMASVPSNWAIGDRIFLFDTAQGLLGNYIDYATISAISGNDVTFSKTITASISSGTNAVKDVCMLKGSQTNAVNYKVYNLVFDGNKANNSSLLNWYIHNTMQSYGFGTVVSDCKFLDTPTENIITQGAMIRNNYAQDLNGSFVHLSCPSEQALGNVEQYMGTFIIGNMCNRVNCVDNSILQHSQAPVTYSWNPGKLIVVGNQFYGAGNSMCIQMNLEAPTKPFAANTTAINLYIVYTSNIFSNFAKIGELEGGTGYIYPNQRLRLFTNNIFDDCGTNDMRSLYTKTNITFENNKYDGNTVVNTDGNSLMYRVDTVISATPTASDLTTKYGNLPVDGEVYVTQLSKLYKKIKTGSSTVAWLDESVSILS